MDIMSEVKRLDGILEEIRSKIDADVQSALDNVTELKRLIESARAGGDLRENAAFLAAKESLVQAEVLYRAMKRKQEVLNHGHLKSYKPDGFAGLGSTVILAKIEKGIEEPPFVIRLVNKAISEAESGLVSTSSPVGSTIEGHEAGDTVQVHSNLKVLTYVLKEVY